jgi:quercetin dioxygenase-like cupin family protein
MSEQNIRGTVLNLNTLVDYQQGSVVSRTIIEKTTGTVTVFAFDKGQKLSEHAAPFDVLAEVIDGSGTFIIDGKPFIITAPQAIIMPANIPHAVTAHDKFKMVLTMIRV